MGNDLAEQFDSPVLFIIWLLQFAMIYPTFGLGNVSGTADIGYLLLIMLGAFALGPISWTVAGHFPDLKEGLKLSRVITGSFIGLLLIIVASLVVSASVGRAMSILYIPSSLVPLKVSGTLAGASPPGGGFGQYIFDVAQLMFYVAPSEQALMAIGPAMSRATHLLEDKPLYAQPFPIMFVGLWAAFHVMYGQYPFWFFFVALGAGEGLLYASDYAGDYSVTIVGHAVFDVGLRSIGFLQSGGLVIRTGS